MKKSYFGVLTLSALMMASCSQDSVYVGEDPDAGGQVIDNVEMSTMPIQFSSPMPGTKGTGTVDTIAGGTVDWGERTVRVYAVEKGTMPEELTDRQTAPLLGGVDIKPADAVEGVITVKDTETYYYPRKGAFDFYGFYSDDAAGEDLSTAVKYDAGKQSYYVPFTIDGTQDLMMAKAAPNQDVTDYNQALLFSAQSARDGYRPKLTLEHQLARLSFYVVWGNENIEDSNPSNEVFVQSLTVKGLKTQGQMHFMAVDDANRTLVWTDGATTDLPIKELDADGNSQDLNTGLDTSIDVNNYNTKAEFEAALEVAGLTIEDVLGKYHPTQKGVENGQIVGTPIMVEQKAGTEGYTIDLVLVQYYDKEGNLIPESQRETKYLSIPVKLGDGKNFDAGYNYDIRLKANSLEIIQVEVDIKPWENGEPVDIDPDL